MTNPDRPHDPMEAARDALRDLGYVPGPEPVRQLRQMAADTLTDIRLSAATTPEENGTRALAHIQLLEAAHVALGVLTDTELDEMEQQHLAEAFGLPEPGDRS